MEFDGKKDHVHLLILRKHFTDLAECFWGNALWSPSCFSGSCGGASIDIVRKYIESQKTPTGEKRLIILHLKKEILRRVR